MKKKSAPVLVSLRVSCPKKQVIFKLLPAQVEWSAHEQECEICGSHGRVQLSFACPVCKGYHALTLSEW